jgi:hypothetical protein
MTAHLCEILDWCNVAALPAVIAFSAAAMVTGDWHNAVIVAGVVWLAVLALFAVETEEVQA